jgi:uncharacterized protein (DUF342 family)
MERIVIEHQIVDPKQQVFNLAKRINEVKEEVKNIREMTNDLLENDSAYSEILDQAKTASRDKKVMKAKILDSQEGFKLKDKMADSRLELKDLKQSLSTALEVYVAKTGSSVIETEMGMKIDIAKQFSIKPSQLSLFE